MKKIYEELELRLAIFKTQDFIRTSGERPAPETSDENELEAKPFRGF